MFSETVSIWRRNFLVFVGYATLMVMTPILLDGVVRSGSALGLFGGGQLYLGFLVQRAVIFDTPFLTRTAPEGGGRIQYVLKGLALGFMMLVPAIILGLVAGVSLLRHTAGNDKGKLLLVVAIVMICFFIIKLLLGTWLPASIKGENTGLGDAFARGVEGFWRLFFQTLGIGFLNMLVLVTVVIIAYAAGLDIQHADARTTPILLGILTLINLFFTSMVDVLFALEVKDEDGPNSTMRRIQNARFQQVVGKPGFSVPQISQAPARIHSGRAQFGRR